MNSKKIILLMGVIGLFIMSSCSNDFLDKQPISSLTPESYLRAETDLASYNIKMFEDFQVFQTEGNPFAQDNGTDVMASRGYENKFVPGQWKVPQGGSEWYFNQIYSCNYFLQNVLPRFKANTLTGDPAQIKHDIGEMYLIRAMVYFRKLKFFGDFPIIKTTLPDNKAILTAASKRAPQNEVARFIIADLDSAILLMKPTAPDGARNRLSQPCAQLMKSRVALYEATWLKYFKGTAFVPNGAGWPGATKDYNASYKFPSGSIDTEIDYFLTQAMASAKIVADATPLVSNNMVIQQSTTDPVNPYCAMFSDIDMSKFSEVLFWRRYDLALGVTNGIAAEIGKGNSGRGFTRGFVESFVMANGLPIYAPGSGYAGDDSIQLVRKDRDGRLQLFLKQPKQLNILYRSPLGTHSTPVEPYPDILNVLGNADYPTGYANRKGLNYDEALCGNGKSYEGEIVFRAVEAYLNYMEASYEKTGILDADAQKYWKAIRTRANVDPDYQKTIDATDLSKEAANNWSVYSGGVMVDKTLYNIRRERMCELLAEGFRDQDLRRWRSMDQMITTSYHIEGFKLWGPMKNWYAPGTLTYGIGDASTVSSPLVSLYLRTYEKTTTSLVYGGYKWAMAHYLQPLPIQQFLITTDDGKDVTKSPLYQNPGWPTTPNVGATF